jgi:hypothetical protein
MPMLRLSSLSNFGRIFSKPLVGKGTETYVAEVDNPLNSGSTGTGIEQMGHIYDNDVSVWSFHAADSFESGKNLTFIILEHTSSQ